MFSLGEKECIKIAQGKINLELNFHNLYTLCV